MSEKYQNKIGTFINIPNVGKGQLKYVGFVEGKQGTFVGIDLLANIGKNDGTYMGKNYFETEYPQSGLFIQLRKVVGLLEEGSEMCLCASNLSSGCVGCSGQQQKQFSVNSAHSVDNFSSLSLKKVRNRTNSVFHRSPTPRRISSGSVVGRRVFSGEANDSNFEFVNSCDAAAVDDANADCKSSASSDHNEPLKTLKKCGLTSVAMESKLREQSEQIQHYKHLLDEQRVVLEEIQPAIDDYEEKLHVLETENKRLQKVVVAEKESQARQKQYFESEHQQLLSVVDQLHKEIKDNEQRMLHNNRRQTVIMDHPSNLEELDQLRLENDELRKKLNNFHILQEKLKKEWEQEREQLLIQNKSLNIEYSNISRELSEFRLKSEDSTKFDPTTENCSPTIPKIHTLETHPSDPETDNIHITGESLPLYQGKKNCDPAAGRILWCALCEKDGHSAFECTEVAF